MSKPPHEMPAFGFFDDMPADDKSAGPGHDAGPAAQSRSQRYLTFGISTQKFCIAVEKVLEVANSRSISALPLPRPHLAGYISVRGEALPVLDMKQMLGIEPADAAHTYRHIIILQAQDLSYAVPVEELYRIVHIEADHFKQVDPHMFGDDTVVTHAAIALNESYLLLSFDRVLQNVA